MEEGETELRPATAIPRSRWVVVREGHYDANWNIEFTVFECPRMLLRDLESVFCELKECRKRRLSGKVLLVPTFQPSKVDMLGVGEEESKEKDRLLENFQNWAKALCAQLKQLDPDCWCDLADPCSGLPVLGKSGGMTYDEVSAMELLFRYDKMQVGACGVISHPAWRTAVYPATMATTASPEVLEEALRRLHEHADEAAG